MSTDEVEWSCDQAWNMTWYSGENINIDIIEESVFFMFKSFSTVDCMHVDISRYLHQVMVL